MSASFRPALARERGFTLLEMVITIGALIFAFAAVFDAARLITAYGAASEAAKFAARELTALSGQAIERTTSPAEPQVRWWKTSWDHSRSEPRPLRRLVGTGSHMPAECQQITDDASCEKELVGLQPTGLLLARQVDQDRLRSLVFNEVVALFPEAKIGCRGKPRCVDLTYDFPASEVLFDAPRESPPKTVQVRVAYEVPLLFLGGDSFSVSAQTTSRVESNFIRGTTEVGQAHIVYAD